MLNPSNRAAGAGVFLRVLGRSFLLTLVLFSGMGLIITVVVVWNLISGGITSISLVTAMFSAAFGGFSSWMAYRVSAGLKEQQRVLMRSAQHPYSPWLWRQDWASGRIESGTAASVVAPWVVAILWILLSSPTAFIFIRLAPANRLALLVLVFPAIGLILLISASRQTLRVRKFGVSYLQLASIPGVVGGKLRGVIEAPFDPAAVNGVRVTLSCIGRYRGSETTNESIIWKNEHVFDRAGIGIGPAGANIPVEFEIPGNLPPAGGDFGSEIVWRVHVKADVPGLDYSARFEVPVFKMAATSAMNPSQTGVEVRPPQKPSIIVTPTTGGMEFVFPAARNIGMAIGVTVAFFLLAGMMIAAGLSFFGTIFIGFFVIILLFLTLQAWFEIERILVESGTIITKKTIFGLGPVRQFLCSEVAELKLVVGMYSGRTGSQIPYYDIQLTNRDGLPFKLAGEIKDKGEADWILSQIRRAAKLG